MAIFSRTRDSHTNKKHATIKHGPSDGYYSEFGWYRMLRNWTHVWRTSYMWCCYCSWCRGANQGGTGGDRRTRRAGSMSLTAIVLVSNTFLCFCELIYGAKYYKGSYTLDKMSKYKIFYLVLEHEKDGTLYPLAWNQEKWCTLGGYKVPSFTVVTFARVKTTVVLKSVARRENKNIIVCRLQLGSIVPYLL